MPSLSEFSARVHPRLRMRLIIFFLVAIGIIGYIVRDVVYGDISWYLALLAIAIGLVVGFVLGRLLTIKWHETEERAVSEMDTVGIIAIAAYIVLDISRDWILGHWLSGPALAAFALAILGGAVFGRGLGMLTSIHRVVSERG